MEFRETDVAKLGAAHCEIAEAEVDRALIVIDASLVTRAELSYPHSDAIGRDLHAQPPR